MTPLHRWVLLATLLGRATSVPVPGAEDACVRHCRGLKYGKEACDTEGLVLQFDGGDAEAWSAIRLCQDPCSAFCRAIWKDLAERRGCVCADSENPPAGPSAASSFEAARDGMRLEPGSVLRSLYRSSLWKPRTRVASRMDAKGDEKIDDDDEGKITRGDESLEKIAMSELAFIQENEPELNEPLEKVAMNEVSFNSESGPGYDEPLENIAMDDLLFSYKNGAKKKQDSSPGKTANGNEQEVSTAEPSSSEEDSVDWDLWCMAQCDNGQGGSACMCDIIP